MGILISLFIQAIMLTVSLTFSLLSMSLRMFGLLLSLLARSGQGRRRHSRPVRSFVPRASSGGVSQGQTLRSPVSYLVLVIVALLVILTAFGASPMAGVAVTLVVVVAGAVWLIRRRGPQTASAQHLSTRFSAVGSMSGAQFEVFTADMLRAMGYGATVLGRSGDQGVDVIATSRDQRIAVQCKNYKKAVGNTPIQEVYAGAKHHGCGKAWVVAPRGFTKGAFELAGSVGVSLFDSGSIMHWITKVDEAAAQSVQGNDTSEREAYYRVLDEIDGHLDELEKLHAEAVGGGRVLDADVGRINDSINAGIEGLNALRGQHASLRDGEPANRRTKMQSRKDHLDYLTTLDIFEVYVGLADDFIKIKEEHALEIANIPSTADKYAASRKDLFEKIEGTRRDLDTLESRNPDMAAGEQVERRAMVETHWQEKKSLLNAPPASEGIPQIEQALDAPRAPRASASEERAAAALHGLTNKGIDSPGRPDGEM